MGDFWTIVGGVSMAPRPEQKLQPQMQPASLSGGPRAPQPAGPKRSTPGAFGGNRAAKGIALAILPIALLGYAAIASGLISFPGAKPDIAHSITATSAINSTVTADQGERGDALARIGIETHNLTQDLAKRMALQTSRPEGMVVTKVFPNTAGERGGLLTGDIILAVDGIPVGQGSGFTSKIESTPVGQSVTLILERGGTTQVLPIKVEQRPCSFDATDQWCAAARVTK
jgi:PDZ domain